MNSMMDESITRPPVSKMSFVNIRGHVQKEQSGENWVR